MSLIFPLVVNSFSAKPIALFMRVYSDPIRQIEDVTFDDAALIEPVIAT
jgi:hypothetical protein